MSFEPSDPDYEISGHVISYKLYDVEKKKTGRFHCTAEGLPCFDGWWLHLPISSFEWVTLEKLLAICKQNPKILFSPIEEPAVESPAEPGNKRIPEVPENMSQFGQMLFCLSGVYTAHRRVAWVRHGQGEEGMMIFTEKHCGFDHLYGVLTTHPEVNEHGDRDAGHALDYIINPPRLPTRILQPTRILRPTIIWQPTVMWQSFADLESPIPNDCIDPNVL